ncbi:MAG: MFS transporter [Dehalococcoidales bacterium]
MPLNMNPSRVFYGWWIVGAVFLITAYVGGVVFYGFTAFFEPIADEMGWSYTQISLAASLRGLETGLFAPVIGIIADRWGSRRLVFSGALITVAGLILLSSTNSLTIFYVSFALIALGMSATTTTVLMTAVANWFRKKIGLASGIALCGFGFGGLLVPLINRLIAIYDWRMTVIILAIGMLVIVTPLSLVFRHKPEDYGYVLDGEKEDLIKPADDSNQSQTTGRDIKASQALKSGAFWRLTIACIYVVTVVSSVVTHVMPYLSTIRVSRSISSLVAAGIPLISIFGRLGLGWLGDKFDKKIIAAGSCVAIGLGVICFGYIATTDTWMPFLILFLILFSIGYGGFSPLRPAIAREYFGRSRFGVIFGLLIGIGWLGGVVGPTLTGWIYDNWSNYQITWFVLGGISVVPFIALLTISALNPTPGG